MLTKNHAVSKKVVSKYLDQHLKLKRGSLAPVVKTSLKKRQAILKLAKKHETPFYLFDRQSVRADIKKFKSVFTKQIPRLEIFYAVKSNPHPFLLKEVVRQALGLDVSSGRELELAIKYGAKKIIFTGPAKTDRELNLAIKYRKKLIINLDSFTELRRLGVRLRQEKTTIRAGVRIATKYHNTWNKFGIPLTDLKRFLNEAKKYPEIQLQGIQCHMSWNKGVEPYQNLIKEIAKYLKLLSEEDRSQIKFIDFGGGFETYQLEGYFPWTTSQGEVIKAAAEHFGRQADFKDKYYLTETVPLAGYAQAIAKSIKLHLDPIIKPKYYCEPGRAISTKSMHLILKVMDVKRSDLVILDGGVNMVGYELFEYFYYPVVNLTRPDTKELSCHLYGSLCTPYDLFGYYCYAKAIKEGDIIMIPNQGAYTYTLAQNFIKPIPETYVLD
ncbi:MAG: alanine racemase [Candidatus Buchananbacteria bacterium]|nr:alanine racemase [Candidatus Buchananbacteria bacterium]